MRAISLAAMFTNDAMSHILPAMVFEHGNYRNFLKAVLADHISNNGNYSLRAFAQKLGFANSYLSEVLGGKKSLSSDAALKIAVRLNLTELETQYFCLLVQLEAETDPEFRSILNEKLTCLKPDRKVFDLSSDVFRVIADWYHFAILELTYLSGFRLTAKTVAERIGISVTEAGAAIERLIRLELLEKMPNGEYRKTQDVVLTQSHIPNAAIKKFHKQLLEKAILAVDSQKPDHRISSTDILPIDAEHIDEVRRLADEFANAVLTISKKSKIKNQVSCLSVQFFTLTSEGKK